MKRVLVHTMTQSGVRNVNGYVYTKDAFESVKERSKNKRIPVIFGPVGCFDFDSIPFGKIIGYATKIEDDYIIMDFIDYETRLAGNELAIAYIDGCINYIHNDKVKAYMSYMINGYHFDHCQPITNINRIAFFYLGSTDPNDITIKLDPSKFVKPERSAKPKHKKRKNKK